MNSIPLEDLEKLTEILYGPKQDIKITEYANFLTDKYSNNYDSFEELFSYFIKTSNQHCQFWLLDLLVHIIKINYNHFNNEMKIKFRTHLLYLFENYILKITNLTFISNKFGLLFITWIKYDFPENWPNVFKDILSSIFNSSEEEVKIKKINMFIDLMLIFDDEFIKFRHTQTDFDTYKATVIKDFIRKDEINDIVNLLTQLIHSYSNLSKKLIKNCIKVVSYLIDWNILNLFGDFTQVAISNLIKLEDYQSECLELLNAILEKGMEITQKYEVISCLNINFIIENILKQSKINDNSLFNICEIVSNLGNFTIECFEWIKTFEFTAEQEMFYKNIFELANYAVFHCVKIIEFSVKGEFKLAIQLCDFISNFINFLKSNENISHKFKELIIPLFSIIEKVLIIPLEYDIFAEIKEDDDFYNFRKEFTSIYSNMTNIPFMNQIISYSIHEKFNKIRNQQANLYEIELAIYLLNIFQTHLKSNDYNNENIKQLASNLFSLELNELKSEIIIVLFFETIIKYQIYVLSNHDILINVIKLFLSKSGIINENLKVSVKICHLFDKFLEKAKTFISDVREEIIETIKYLIEVILNTKNFLILIEYGVLFHSLSLAVFRAKDKIDNVSKEVFLIFQKIFNEFGCDEEKFYEICRLITNYLKGFNQEVNDKSIYLGFLNNLYENYYMRVSHSSKCKYSIITVLQRYINILGKESIQYIEYFLFNDIKYPCIEIYEDSIKLLQNLTQILKKDSKQTIIKTFHLFYTSIKNISLPKSDISDEEKTFINIYSNFVKLIQNISNEDLVEVLFQGIDQVNTNELLNFMIFIASEILDSAVKKSIIKSLKSIISYLTVNVSKFKEEVTNLILGYFEIILNGIINIFSKINYLDAYDITNIPELIIIHQLIFKNAQNFYIEFISRYIDQDSGRNWLDILATYDQKRDKDLNLHITLLNIISKNYFEKSKI